VSLVHRKPHWLTFSRIQNIEVKGLYSNPVQFYEFLQNRVMIIFQPKFEDSNPESEFSLVLSKQHNYDIVCIVLFKSGVAIDIRCRLLRR